MNDVCISLYGQDGPTKSYEISLLEFANLMLNPTFRRIVESINDEGFGKKK